MQIGEYGSPEAAFFGRSIGRNPLNENNVWKLAPKLVGSVCFQAVSPGLDGNKGKPNFGNKPQTMVGI